MEDRRSLPPLEDDFTRALLRSAEVDEPSGAAYAKVAAALGVGTALGVGASLPAPAAVVASASGASALARWSGSLASKLALLGVSGALLLGGVAGYLWHRTANNAAAGRGVPRALAVLPAPLQVRSGAQAAASASSTAAAPLSLATPLPVTAEGSRMHVRHSHPVRAGASVSSVSSASSLPEQVQSLDRARVALSSGDAGSALQEIAHYRKAWPKGVFLTEASVLEIEALAKRGERSLAAARARAFVAAHPDSPQAERLRTLIPADQP
jgi:hypothetical protein